MAITIEAFEDWGAATGTPAKGTTRTKITNANLKSYSDPAQHYYLNDVIRPLGKELNDNISMCSYVRYIAFKISGTYAALKNVKITIPAAMVQDDWRVMAGITNVYTAPSGYTNEFDKFAGSFDGSLNTVDQELILYPRLSTTGPEAASTRPIQVVGGQTFWTEWVKLQFMCHPSDFANVESFGAETIKLTLDELKE
jgi:hypothetical protein